MRQQVDWRSLSDEELALRCSGQLDEGLEELIRRYEQRVRDCARRMSLDRQDADDLVQEIFLRMLTALPRFRGDSAFGTWMYRLAHNTCIDAFRRSSRERDHLLTLPRAEEDADPLELVEASFGRPEEELDATIQECYVGRALASLPETYREVVRLRLGEGRSSEEVARILGTTVDAVKSRLRRARRLLREFLVERQACPVCSGLGALRVTPTSGVD